MKLRHLFCVLLLGGMLCSCTGETQRSLQRVNEGLEVLSTLENATYTAVREAGTISQEERVIVKLWEEKGRYQNSEDGQLDWFVKQTTQMAGQAMVRTMQSCINGEYRTEMPAGRGQEEIVLTAVDGNPAAPMGLTWLAECSLAPEDVADVRSEAMEEGGVQYIVSFSEQYLEKLPQKEGFHQTLCVVFNQDGVVTHVEVEKRQLHTQEKGVEEYERRSFLLRGYNEEDFEMGYH